MKRARPLLAALALLSDQVAGAPLGRLFFTPERRAELERQRRGDVRAALPAGENRRLRLDGFVTRSGGGGTVWLNGRPQDQAAADDTVRAGVAARRLGQVAPAAAAPPGDEPR